MSTNEEHLNYSVEDNLGLLERIDNNLKMSPKYIRFNKFIKTHNLTDEYSVRDLSRWHMILTSSCVQGISDFAKEHNLDFDKTKMTVPKFFELDRKSVV